MTIVSDVSTPVATPGDNFGSSTNPAGAASSDDSLPVTRSITDSTLAMVAGAENNLAEATSSAGDSPAQGSNTESPPAMASGVNPGSNSLPTEGKTSGDDLPETRSDSEVAQKSPADERALVLSSQVKFGEDDLHEDSKSYYDHLTWLNRKLNKLLKDMKREVTEKLLETLSKL